MIDIRHKLISYSFADRWETIDFELCLDDNKVKFKKLKKKEISNTGKYPVVDQGESFISGYINDIDTLYKGELPVIIFGDHTTNLKYIDFEFAVGADGTKLLRPVNYIDSRYFYYFLLSVEIPHQGYSRHYKFLKSIKFPLAPLNEQKRIVKKLDAIFKKINQNKARLERIPQLLKDFRQQVFQAAVTGELTKEWREVNDADSSDYVKSIIKDVEENYIARCKKAKLEGERKPKDQRKNKRSTKPVGNLPDIPKEWSYHRMEDVSYLITDGVHHRPNYIDEGVTFLSVKNVRPFKINPSNCKFISQEDHNTFIKRCNPEVGDILYTKVGATYGYAAAIDLKEEFSIFVSLALIKQSKLFDSEFVELLFNSELIFEQARRRVSGSGVPDLHLIEIRDFRIPVPTIEEQRVIVQIVKEKSDLIDRIDLVFEQAKTKIEQLPQTILAKAFRGELVEQDPNDEPASELLAKIKEAKKALKKKKK